MKRGVIIMAGYNGNSLIQSFIDNRISNSNSIKRSNETNKTMDLLLSILESSNGREILKYSKFMPAHKEIYKIPLS